MRDLDLRRSGRDLGGISIWAGFDLGEVRSGRDHVLELGVDAGHDDHGDAPVDDRLLDVAPAIAGQHGAEGRPLQHLLMGGGRAGRGVCSGVCVEYWGVTRGVTRGVT